MANTNNIKAGTKTIKIDGTKLQTELTSRGLNHITVSREMGYSDRYIYSATQTGMIGLPAANILKLKYNIDIDLLKPDDEFLEDEDKVLKTPKKKSDPETDRLVESLKQEIIALNTSVKDLQDEFHNYRVAMLQYMKKFENHKKYGHF